MDNICNTCAVNSYDFLLHHFLVNLKKINQYESVDNKKHERTYQE
jgi:hypothetical protein